MAASRGVDRVGVFRAGDVRSAGSGRQSLQSILSHPAGCCEEGGGRGHGRPRRRQHRQGPAWRRNFASHWRGQGQDGHGSEWARSSRLGRWRYGYAAGGSTHGAEWRWRRWKWDCHSNAAGHTFHCTPSSAPFTDSLESTPSSCTPGDECDFWCAVHAHLSACVGRRDSGTRARGSYEGESYSLVRCRQRRGGLVFRGVTTRPWAIGNQRSGSRG